MGKVAGEKKKQKLIPREAQGGPGIGRNHDKARSIAGSGSEKSGWASYLFWEESIGKAQWQPL